MVSGSMKETAMVTGSMKERTMESGGSIKETAISWKEQQQARRGKRIEARALSVSMRICFAVTVT
jgi:hypothetical protein